MIQQYDFNVWIFQQGTINEHYKRYNPNVTNDLVDAYLHEMEARKNLKTSNFTCKCFTAVTIYTFSSDLPQVFQPVLSVTILNSTNVIAH
jgi:hypothetical protein